MMKMSWEKVLKFSGEEFMFNVSAKVMAENEDGEEIDIDERKLHGYAEDVLKEMIGKVFSQGFLQYNTAYLPEIKVTCEITSVSEKR
tara:strand:- start:239 stop:499 length:261 start_codon:yes stop_codon:yes gene_type:complete